MERATDRIEAAWRFCGGGDEDSLVCTPSYRFTVGIGLPVGARE
jgi:hypothetical protein